MAVLTQVLDEQWVLDSAAQGQLLPEGDYLGGQTKLEAPGSLAGDYISPTHTV